MFYLVEGVCVEWQVLGYYIINTIAMAAGLMFNASLKAC